MPSSRTSIRCSAGKITVFRGWLFVALEEIGGDDAHQESDSVGFKMKVCAHRKGTALNRVRFYSPA